jgi:hypothetical protein
LSELETTNPIQDGPVGIGGWLLLPIFGLFATPVLGALQFGIYKNVFAAWPFLDVYQSLVIVVELLVNAILVFAAPAALLFFLFKRLGIFPGWFMIWAIVSPIFLIADAILVYLAFPEPGGTAFDKETVRAISQSVWGALIWVPYMMKSRRVANTFVN